MAAQGVQASTDRELVEQFKAGDRAAFKLLYDRHRAAVRATARARSSDPHAVEDIVQEAFARLLVALPTFRGGDLVSHWLQRVACRLATDVGRRRGREFADPDQVDRSAEVATDGTEEQALFRWEGHEAMQVLATLAERDADLIAERELAGDSVGVIARRRGWTVGSTRVALTRARHRLRAQARGRGIIGLVLAPWAWLRRGFAQTRRPLLQASEVAATALAVGFLTIPAPGPMDTQVEPSLDEVTAQPKPALPSASPSPIAQTTSPPMRTSSASSVPQVQAARQRSPEPSESRSLPVDSPQVGVEEERPDADPDASAELTDAGVPLRVDVRLPRVSSGENTCCPGAEGDSTSQVAGHQGDSAQFDS